MWGSRMCIRGRHARWWKIWEVETKYIKKLWDTDDLSILQRQFLNAFAARLGGSQKVTLGVMLFYADVSIFYERFSVSLVFYIRL